MNQFSLKENDSYIKAIKKFISYFNDEDSSFCIGGDLTIGEKFEECMDDIEEKCPDTYKKKWRYYSESDDGFNTTYFIIWIEKNHLSI